MKTVDDILRSEALTSSRASDRTADASVSEQTTARLMAGLEAREARLRGELRELKDGAYNPREHPARRAKLAALLARTTRRLRELKQTRLL
jgi:uncharacterized protein YcbX